MFTTGLVSVSFRQESPETIIAAVCAAELGGIEWGGDVHVPCGDFATAERVGRLTREAGLCVAAYGSYYRIGTNADVKTAFDTTLQTAKKLGAPVVRVWCGTEGSADTPPERRAALTAEAKAMAAMAEAYGITITLECHGGTLTDDYHSAVDFVRAVGHPRLRMYWQPNQFRDHAYNCEAAAALAADTVNLHVFHWDSKRTYPLADGTADWRDYLAVFRQTGQTYGLLLEFMHDGRLESLPATAATLRSWLEA